MPIRFIPILLLLLPIAEIAGFIVVGGEIGVLATLALIFATSIAGIVLLRIQGIGLLARIRRETELGRVPGREMIHAAMIMLAGILLLIPGFITDLAGLLLFIPVVRDFGWKLLRGRVVTMPQSGRSQAAASHSGRIIDLDESEYDSPPRPDSPWRRD